MTIIVAVAVASSLMFCLFFVLPNLDSKPARVATKTAPTRKPQRASNGHPAAS